MRKTILRAFPTAIFTSLLLITNIHSAAIIDNDFGTNGTLSINIGTDQVLKDIAVQPDGKILTGGTLTGTSGDRDIFLARYNSDGTFDNSFGNNGIAIVPLTNRDESINDFELQSDGKIVAVGNQQVFAGVQIYDFLAVRLNSDGSLDSSFGENGVVIENHEQNDSLSAVTLQNDGKIVAVGFTREFSRSFAVITRLNVDGTFDTDFRGSGLFLRELATPATTNRFEGGPTDVQILNDGKILLGGNYEEPLPGGFDQVGFHEMIFNSDGSNAKFPQSIQRFGYIRHGYSDESYEVEVLANGKVIRVSGVGVYIEGNRYRQDGSSLVVLPNGNFAVAGSRFGGNLKIYSENAFIGGGWNVPTGKLAATPDNNILILNENSITKVSSVTSQATRHTSFNREFGTGSIVDEKADFAAYRPAVKKTFIFKTDGSINERNSDFDAIKVFPEFYPLFVFEDAYRETSVKYGERSSKDQTFLNFERFTIPDSFPLASWGSAGDIAVGGDFDGTGRFDVGVFRPSNGTWYIRGGETIKWGTAGDKPVPADYDFDGITDYAIYRPSSGTWWVRKSSDGGFFSSQFGVETDIPLTGDYDADGFADLTVYRPSEGNWYQFLTTEGFRVIKFGIETDHPVPGDYDGDGRFDLAVYRDGLWYLLQSTEGFKAIQFGTAEDIPVSVRYDE